jgi:HKD family nuclease
MAVRMIDANWGDALVTALRADSGELRIICPFIKLHGLERLLAARSGHVQVITRFNLADFAEGVSDISALRRLLDIGAEVRGIRGLHAKVYLLGTRHAAITSANLTKAALSTNHEFGIIDDDPAFAAECKNYFDRLWVLGRTNLSREQVEQWDQTVLRHRAAGGRCPRASGLGDFGVDAGFAESPQTNLPAVFVDAEQAFVKFLGLARDNRAPLSMPTIEEVERAGCHWAVAYPASKRPRSVKDGAVMFIARLVRDPHDIHIFGRAIGMKHIEGRDDATSQEISERPWKEVWPRYIRLHDAEFVAGTMANGVSLNELMDTLGADAFAATQRNAAAGGGKNTNPRKAYMQQAAVELSAKGFAWVSEQLQAKFDEHGKIPQDTLNKLDWPNKPTSLDSEE